MAEYKPALKLPFTQFPGLDQDSARRIWRDFEEIARTTGISLFDAIIDPSLSVSDPSTHQYKNLTDLIAHETWSTSYTFIVGVKQRNNPQIIEPTSPIDISAKGDLALFGLGPVIPDASHKGWDWATLTCAATQQVTYYNLAFEPTSSGS